MDDRKFIPIGVSLSFLFWWTVSYESYIWTMGKDEERRTPFSLLFVLIVLFFFFTVQREKKEVLLFNRILPWSSDIFRTYRLFYCFVNLIYAVLYWLVSYHGWRIQNQWANPFRNLEIWRSYHRTPWVICQPLNQLLLRNAKKQDYFIIY